MIKSKSNRRYQMVINLILLCITASMILPLILLFMSSITDESTLIVNGYSFFPKEISFNAYQYIMKNSETIFRAYGVTIIVTVIGTIINVILSALMAYPL